MYILFESIHFYDMATYHTKLLQYLHNNWYLHDSKTLVYFQNLYNIPNIKYTVMLAIWHDDYCQLNNN